MPRQKRKLDEDSSSDENNTVVAKKVRSAKPETKTKTKSTKRDEPVVKKPKQKRKLDEDTSSDEDKPVVSKKVRRAKPETKTNTKSTRKDESTDSTETSEKKGRSGGKDAPAVRSSKLASWNEAELLSEMYDTRATTMENIVQLFREDNTIPFICRYRKELIGNISPDVMRNIKATYNQLVKLKVKQESVITKLEKENLLSEELHRNILAVKSSDELDHLYEPFKTASKTSLSEKAKSKGLQDPAERILFGRGVVKLDDFVNAANGLEDINAVRDGLKHIILNIINKDVDVLEEIRRLLKVNTIRINSSLIKPTKSSKNDVAKASNNADQNASKFETYYDFHSTVEMIKPHQTLAINRGESQKILKVTVDIPDRFKGVLYQFLYQKYYRNKGTSYPEREEVLKLSFNEYIAKKLQPLITRRIRKELTKSAEKASIDVFATNLKQLLLTGPLKGQRILGIDPGFTNGCKIALISECNDVLASDVIYPHTKSSQNIKFGHTLANMMRKHDCTTIALGNGTACRETEKWLSDLLDQGILDSKRVRYSIVNEQGSSIYSCSDLAKKEFPDLDVNLISAVARRLADPLGELVKVEPKHLGVGMYQHDINERHLSESLNEVVMECVSFVGVDVNTASVTLLRHVAGLTETRAENICKYRVDNGPFKCREELKKVKLIGDKTFEQCAGFLRIIPATEGIENFNPLDSTWIHPESYSLAERIIKKCNAKKQNIGTGPFIAKIKEFMQKNSIDELAKELMKPRERIESVMEALERELFRDYREDLLKTPLFKQGLTKMSDLVVGAAVSGAITNVTHFGCFVDIGVGRDALIHTSKLEKMTPRIGDRVECVVLSVDAGRGRINLKLANIL